MSITLWIPSTAAPTWAVYRSVWDLQTPNNEKLRLVNGRANNPKYEWNRVVKEFLDTADEWLLSWHSDVVGAPETLMRLLSWNEPLVSALIFMRQAPVIPHIWKKYRDGDRYVQRINETLEWFYSHPDYIRFGPFVTEQKHDDALVEVEFTSTSCTLIHRSVLEAMRPLVNDLWFLMDDDIKGGGEDRRFFEYAKQVGFTGYVDRSCVVGHLPGEVPTSAADFIAWCQSSTYENTGEQVNGKETA